MSVFLLALSATRRTSIREISTILFIAVLGVFGYGMAQKYFGFPVISTMNEEFSKGLLLYLDQWTRISSTFAGHYDLAIWLTMLLSLTPALILKVKKLVSKVMLLLMGAGSFYLLILTASRISFIAYLLGISVTMVLLKKYRWLLAVILFSLVFGFRSKELNIRLSSTFKPLTKYTAKISQYFAPQPEPTIIPTPILPTPTTPAIAVIPSGPVEKPKTIVIREARTWPKPEEVEAAAARSTQIRFQVEWPRAIKAFLKNPLLGTGYSSLGLATDNDYLRMLGEIGLLGFLSFGLIIFHILSTIYISFIKDKKLILAGFIGLLTSFLANAVFIDAFEASKVAFSFWILMGISYAIAVGNNENKT